MEHLTVIHRSRIWARRLRQGAFLALASAGTLWFVDVLESHFYRPAFWTGYLLAALICFLGAFSLRKRLSFLPWIGTATFWMQLHIYGGLFAGLLFALHIEWQWPNGPLEFWLAACFFCTFVSGLIGLAISRVYPRRLAILKTQVIFERIPDASESLVLRADHLVNQLPGSSATLKRFYINRIAPFLVLPRSFHYVWQPSTRECRRLVDDLLAMDRYLGDPDRQVSRQLMQIIREKDDLDFHWVLQSRLKYWLFFHIGLTQSLLLLMAVHALAVHAHAGGRP